MLALNPRSGDYSGASLEVRSVALLHLQFNVLEGAVAETLRQSVISFGIKIQDLRASVLCFLAPILCTWQKNRHGGWPLSY